MFEHFVEKALEQVDNQIAQLRKRGQEPISIIVLAGGGGTSKYVISRFQDHCLSNLGGKVIVRRDERSWSAVTRGAATRGLEGGMVISRESKRAYGFVCHQNSMKMSTTKKIVSSVRSLASECAIAWTGSFSR
jgi:hypothetical protein